MKSKSRFFAFFFVCIPAFLAAATHQLKLTDVRNSMEEMFTYHVEIREMTPIVIKRAFKNYVEQFDSQRIYFTYAEVKPFFEINSSQIEHIINHYYADEYPEFGALNRSMGQAINRARGWRQEFYADFIKEGDALVAAFPDEQPTQYASTKDILRKRVRAQLLHLFKLENRAKDPDFWTVDRRQKICNLYEKRFSQYESKYVATEAANEHYFSMHILKSMARSLDAHTAYFSPQEAYEMRSSLEKQFEGVGVAFRESLEGIEVADVIKGGSAEKSGQVHIGDFLVEIDGQPVTGSNYQEILDMLKGDGKKQVVLGLKRLEGTSETFIKVDLKREKIILDDERVQFSTEPFADGVIGKIILPSFYESSDAPSCEADIREALRQMKKKGTVYGLVFDMRDNLGGFLSQAVKVSGIFMTSGVVVVSKYAQGEIQYLRSVDPRLYYDGPLVILTSKMSASAAEIVAQALQDYGIGLVVGDPRTYGKGSIQYQTVTDPHAPSYFKVTVGRYYTVSGRSTQIEGVQADIHVPTAYAPYNVGERYLEYALKNDQIAPVYNDPLTDIQGSTKLWFQKNYLPYLQKKESQWVQMLPALKKNSQYRIDHNSNFQLFLKHMDEASIDIGMNDLQMQEAVNIVKDMISLIHEQTSNHPGR
ncbi:MAG: PDZ domain-containing protein [Rhabdochlamydiaceae bacterium]|nr:PDZ domain-containing protein [Rhabdochlamydiaceae bacterium]